MRSMGTNRLWGTRRLRGAVAAQRLLAALCALLVCLMPPAVAYATYNRHSAHNVVQVGIVEQVGSAQRDENGILRGFDAEYLSRISQYAEFDIQYSYYEGFDAVLNALEEGQVDMVPGISKTAEREERFLFGDSKMGSGSLNLRVRPDDDRYEYGNITQIASMRVGAIAGSIMSTKAQQWADQAAIDLDLTEYPSEDSLVAALYDGSLDGAFVNDSVLKECREILKLNVMDFYVAFNKDQTDLKQAVDSAMNRILSEDFLYFEHLESKYQPKDDAPLVFTAAEKQYLDSHTSKPLTVAVVSNNPPYSETRVNKRSGAVFDYYRHLEDVIKESGSHITFDYMECPDFDTAISAVSEGEADIVGMTCIDATTARELGLLLTSSYSMQGIASISMSDAQASTAKEGDTIRAAVLDAEKDVLASFLAQDKETYRLFGYASLDDCYQALQSGAVDCMVASTMRANWILNQHRSGTFVINMITDSNLPFCAAVTPRHAVLGAILSKASANTKTDMSAIFAANTTPRTDIVTVFNRLPLHLVIAFFVIALVAVGSLIFGITRVLRNREIRRKDQELIDAQHDLLEAYEHDALTGLINRRGALRRANTELRDNGPYSMALVSIDNIGAINEAYGHSAGDKVMVEVASRLVDFCKQDRDHRVVYRYRMGLYLVVVRDELLKADSPLSMEIHSLSHAPVRHDFEVGESGTQHSETIRLLTSMGIATSDGTQDPEQVIRGCSMALDQAREAESDPICVYSEALQDNLTHMNEIQDVVERAIENDSFVMLYQPQVDLRSQSVTGYEALVRIQNGAVSPGEFIPVAESNGLIRQIGRITTELVVRQLAAWRDTGVELRPVSINYSSMQATDIGYLDYLLDLLRTYHIDPSLIKIEITERFFMRNEAETAQFFERLEQEGIQLLMDDFGTGYSSLNYLAYIPVDVIKLDKSIVDAFLTHDAQTAEDKKGNNFVRNLILLAHDMGKKIIVEGVEEKWQADLLTTFDCDCIQGYFYAKPLPPDDAVRYAPSRATD